MDNGTYVSLSLATAMHNALDVTANNIANANTAGFKGERVVFDSYLHRETGLDGGQDTDFLIDRGSYMNPEQGAMTRTGNPLDLALQGDAWFGYETGDGRTAYGRDGRFALDPDGTLVTLNGAKVLDAGGAPIALPPDLGGDVSISQDGAISTMAGGVIGRIGLFELPDLQSYERLGAGMFLPPEGAEGARAATDGTRVMQGMIEASNIQPVVEMTRLMSIQQAYERALKLVSGEDDLTRDMLRRIGSVS
ncbi:flagellar basal-body rod protein FlgF [Limimaricola cinnabarinus]|jgi:flagellar basal-body rod protein FlgF|uniref:Flagellar basal-body rod protein FlgF n=1 Tax=Limimaricola cinnabarinus TaxID=1125964 RepID=A0A2G1MGW2_9RHOB|nr:flagellar basal-body rod protein FlgF [Limimaricola cinnabarinus]PHP27924.1 flagellar basal-body rod protein FlgF [Limimaricola cinnabarinus]